jgi:predicted lipoprotein
VGFDLSWEMSSSAARMISAPDTTHASWWGKPVSLTTSSTKALVSIVIPLSGGALRLGGGPAIRSTDTGDGRPLTETTPVFIVGYSFFRD